MIEKTSADLVHEDDKPGKYPVTGDMATFMSINEIREAFGAQAAELIRRERAAQDKKNSREA